MFKRDKIASRKAFKQVRSVRVPNDSGGATEELETVRIIYGKVRESNNRRTDEQGQMLQDVTHVIESNFFRPYPASGDVLERNGVRYVVHSVDNPNEHNQMLKIRVAKS